MIDPDDYMFFKQKSIVCGEIGCGSNCSVISNGESSKFSVNSPSTFLSQFVIIETLKEHRIYD